MDDFSFNQKLRNLAVANFLLSALNELFQGPFFKTQKDFNVAMNRQNKKSNLQATHKYAKRLGNKVLVGRPIIKARLNE